MALHPHSPAASPILASGSSARLDPPSPTIHTQPRSGPPSPTLTTSGQSSSSLWQRRQNVACDGCKVRKIKCIRTEDDTSCTFCQGRGVECTRYYLTLSAEAALKKASMATKKRRRGLTNTNEDVEPSPASPTTRSTPAHPDVREGSLVQIRDTERHSHWQATPRRVAKIIYRPVAVVLDDDIDTPIAIEHVRLCDGTSLPPTPPSAHSTFDFDDLVPPRPSFIAQSAPPSPTGTSFHYGSAGQSRFYAPASCEALDDARPLLRHSTSAGAEVYHPAYIEADAYYPPPLDPSHLSPPYAPSPYTYMHAPLSQLSLHDPPSASPSMPSYDAAAGQHTVWMPGQVGEIASRSVFL